jgi:hypothetical protein
MSGSDVQQRLDAALGELERLRAENGRLRTLLELARGTPAIIVAGKRPETASSLHLDSGAAASEKVALIRDLFRSRETVYALRWENARTAKSGYVPATPGGWTKSGPTTYLPLTDEAIERHLRGRESIGIYPLFEDDSCWFLACDFDGETWQLDALALLEACGERGVPAALECSRSGWGGHVWIFFSTPVAAGSARKLGALLLRDAMTSRAEVDLASYDRLFPNQDFLPQKGFGNLIALPLQGRCRAAGTSVFLDPVTLEPWPDQWAFLGSIARLAPDRLEQLLANHEDLPVGPAVLATPEPARRDVPIPPEIRCTIAADVAIPRSLLPPSLLAKLKHLASLHNPLFYERQRLRLSTHQTPRLIRCYEEDLTHLHLPRGLLPQLEEAVERAGSRLAIEDRRPAPKRLPLEFHGELTPLQQAAIGAMLGHESGVLVAPPGSGKTVMACALIAERKLADADPCPQQAAARPVACTTRGSTRVFPRNRLAERRRQTQADGRRRLGDDPEPQGRRRSGCVLQHLRSRGGRRVPPPAGVLLRGGRPAAPVRHFLGLTATPYRRDGLQEILAMQCGPIRHRIGTDEGPAGEIDRYLDVRETTFAVAGAAEAPIQELFRQLVENEERNTLVCDDVEDALAQGGRCLVLSQWKEHCNVLAEGLRSRGVSPVVLEGGLGKRARTALLDTIERTSPTEPLVVVATGQYLGEGFDCPQLDTLFLAFPVSFKGRLVQYTGRLLRAHDGKTSVRVYDYADVRVPVLRAMHTRRLATYKRLGFSENEPAATSTQLAVPILVA